nr:hypothetical protein [Tanacetum cinerariifolium]GFA40148.1 hypothetical protein [Tanacetum cinerariifolium]
MVSSQPPVVSTSVAEDKFFILAEVCLKSSSTERFEDEKFAIERFSLQMQEDIISYGSNGELGNLLVITSSTPPAFIGSLFIPFRVQHGNMTTGPRASIRAEGRVHYRRLIALLAASGSDGGSSNLGYVVAMLP